MAELYTNVGQNVNVSVANPMTQQLLPAGVAPNIALPSPNRMPTALVGPRVPPMTNARGFREYRVNPPHNGTMGGMTMGAPGGPPGGGPPYGSIPLMGIDLQDIKGRGNRGYGRPGQEPHLMG